MPTLYTYAVHSITYTHASGYAVRFGQYTTQYINNLCAYYSATKNTFNLRLRKPKLLNLYIGQPSCRFQNQTYNRFEPFKENLSICFRLVASLSLLTFVHVLSFVISSPVVEGRIINETYIGLSVYTGFAGQPLMIPCITGQPVMDPGDLAERGGIISYLWTVRVKGSGSFLPLDDLKVNENAAGVYAQARHVLDTLTGNL